jgi:hypothetical protein
MTTPLFPRWLAHAGAVLATLAWVFLAVGLVLASRLPREAAPNPVIMFSPRGLDSLLVELGSLALGVVGLVLCGVTALGRAARGRWLLVSAAANAAVCVTCLTLLA